MVGAACVGYLAGGIRGALVGAIAVVALELLVAFISFTIGRPS